MMGREIVVLLLMVWIVTGCEYSNNVSAPVASVEHRTLGDTQTRIASAKAVPPKHLSCDLSSISKFEDSSQLPSFKDGEANAMGRVKSIMTFHEVVVQGKKGIKIDENLTIAYDESPSKLIAERLRRSFDEKFRSAETCQFSIVGTQVANDGPITTLTGQFIWRKCVGTDYPCGETCEIRWDYQSCRTNICRATAITNLFSGDVTATVTTSVKEHPPTSLDIDTTATLGGNVSRGDIADALSRVGLNDQFLIGAVPKPDFIPIISQFPPVDVPQEAILYKPEISKANWTTANAAEFPQQAPMAISVTRSQIIERTAACEWLRCRRSPNPEQCRAQP